MKNKLKQFPQPPGHDIPRDEPRVVFTLGKQRFAVQYTVTEVKSEPAKVIPIQKRRQRKGVNPERNPE